MAAATQRKKAVAKATLRSTMKFIHVREQMAAEGFDYLLNHAETGHDDPENCQECALFSEIWAILRRKFSSQRPAWHHPES